MDKILDFFSTNYKALIIVAVIAGGIALHFIFKYFIKKNNRKLYNILLFIFDWIVFFTTINLLISFFEKLSFINTPFINLSSVHITLMSIFLVCIIIIIVTKFIKLLKTYILPSVFKKYGFDKGSSLSLTSLIKYIIIVIATFFCLSVLGIHMNNLTAFTSLFGVGIGFGLQNIIANFISGIILLFERPIKVGDRIVVNGVVGDVSKIMIRATVVRTLSNEHIIIPNSSFLSQNVINQSYSDNRLRLTISIGIAYEADVDLVKKAFLEAVNEVKKVNSYITDEPEPTVNFLKVDASSFDFKLFVWITDPSLEVPITSQLHFKILEMVRKYDIEMAYNQYDIRFRTNLNVSKEKLSQD